MLFDKFTHVKHSVVFSASRQEISGLHGEVHVFVSWDISKGLDARETQSDLHLHCSVFLGSRSSVLISVGIQAAFSALSVGAGGCVLGIN